MSDTPDKPAWGPWMPGIDPVERTAQLRCLQALVRVFGMTVADPNVAPLLEALRKSEKDYAVNAQALSQHLFDLLPPITQRRIIATFAAIHPGVRKDAHKAPATA